MGRIIRKTIVIAAALLSSFIICACSGGATANESAKPETEAPATQETVQQPEAETAEAAAETKDDYTEGLGDTFSGDTSSPDEEADKPKEDDDKDEKEDDDAGESSKPEGENKDVDLILFMGQSNMSGAGGDASLAPYVPPEAGMEFRAISDPTRLYPITEPFGVNENNPTGLYEYPGAKKGSLVSAFVNEYHKLTGRRVVAVSISMGATDMNKWITDGAVADVKGRFETSVSFLKNNGYNIGHMYVLWLHGESDAIDGTDPEVYRTCLDDIMRPLFIGGVRKVFIIMPGRTIDYRDIFLDIINEQKKICADSDYYAVATTILTKVSTEYMLDMYHYNQHVLNMIGIESAKSVAYYTEHNVEKIVYDYRTGKYIVPDGVDPDSQEKEDPIDLEEININDSY